MDTESDTLNVLMGGADDGRKTTLLMGRQTKMKLFGDPKLKKKADKLAAMAVLTLAATCTAIGAIWLLGAAFHVVFSWMGVA